MTQEIITIVKATLSGAYVLFLPGFFISYLFFKKRKIDVIERIALSFALSVSIVPLIVFFFNLVGVKLSALTVLIEIAGIILLTILALYIQYRRKHYEH